MKKLTFGCLLLIPNVNLKKWYGQIGLQLHVPEQEASETVREPPEKHQKRSGSRPNSLRNVPNSLGNGLVRAARQTSETVREPREKLSEIVWEPPEPQKRSRSEPLENARTVRELPEKLQKRSDGLG